MPCGNIILMGNFWSYIEDIDIKTVWDGMDMILTVALLATMIIFIWWLRLNLSMRCLVTHPPPDLCV